MQVEGGRGGRGLPVKPGAGRQGVGGALALFQPSFLGGVHFVSRGNCLFV